MSRASMWREHKGTKRNTSEDMKFHTHMTLTCDWPPASFHGISRMLPRALPESTLTIVYVLT